VDYELKLIHGDSLSNEEFEMIKDFCSKNRDLENYTDIGWKEKPYTLLYKLKNTDEFYKGRGGFYLLIKDGAIIHITGFNRSQFHPEVYICGVRTLTDKEHRHNLLMSNFTVPAQHKEICSLGGKMVIYCFDTANKFNLYHIVKNKKFNLFLKNKQNDYETEEVYKDLVPHDNIVKINYTRHNVLYKLLDKNFVFDWSLIEENV
jgi:hypothetical protein